MCMFSGDINSVFGTKIFARTTENGKQFLVYSMRYSADLDMAMILPLPTPPSSPEDAVKFIDLSDYPSFFDDVDNIFDEFRFESMGGSPRSAQSSLKVESVGSFEASFVPHKTDFVRLDKRFRLSDDIWDQLPEYNDYGFAVFKLKAGKNNIHPMAFEFPSHEATKLFFPTVHVHHGQVEPEANFDHVLYCQSPYQYSSWEMKIDFDHRANGYKPVPITKFVNVEKMQGIVDPEMPMQKFHIYGRRKNQDSSVSTVDNISDVPEILRRSLPHWSSLSGMRKNQDSSISNVDNIFDASEIPIESLESLLNWSSLIGD